MMRYLVISLSIGFLAASCGKEQGDIISLSSETVVEEQTPYLVIGGQDGNHRGFAFYTLDGVFVKGGDFRTENALPRGLTAYDATSVLISLDTTDSIFRVEVDGTKTQFHGSAQFSGNIYDVAVSNSGRVYAIETNRIEVFDEDGNRLTSSLIPTTVGSCTLNSPRGLAINSDGNLVVIDQTSGGEVLTYDISTATASCLSNVAFSNSPDKVLVHSDGFLYITTLGDDRVYRADPDGSNRQVIWDTDTAIINNPTGIAEHPSGDLLVASSNRDTVERITTSGERVGDRPFIQDTHSLNISDIVVIGDISNDQ